MSEVSSRQQIFLNLFANWNKGAGTKQLESWEEQSYPWSEEQLEVGRRRCQADRSRTFMPAGFAEFANYLPAPVSPGSDGSPPWWHQEGSWGGDWSKVSRKELAKVGGAMLATTYSTEQKSHAASRDKFIAMCRSAGVTDVDLASERAKFAAENRVPIWDKPKPEEQSA